MNKMKLPDGMQYGFDNKGKRICIGAKMGRISVYPVSKLADLKFRLVRMSIDGGGYDQGGAYWGLGEPMYWARSVEEVPTKFDTGHTTGRTEPAEMFLRAKNRNDAKSKIRKEIPNATFFR